MKVARYITLLLIAFFCSCNQQTDSKSSSWPLFGIDIPDGSSFAEYPDWCKKANDKISGHEFFIDSMAITTGGVCFTHPDGWDAVYGEVNSNCLSIGFSKLDSEENMAGQDVVRTVLWANRDNDPVYLSELASGEFVLNVTDYIGGVSGKPVISPIT